MKSEFCKDDFRKGWQVHQVCDIVHNKIKKRAFPKIFIKEYNGYDKKRWVAGTAIKTIQDMNDRQQFPIQNYLQYLKFDYNPNGEKIGEVKKYNQIVIGCYDNKEEFTTEDYFKAFIGFGVDEDLVLKVKNKAEEFLQDKKIVKKIEDIYDDMINSYKEVF